MNESILQSIRDNQLNHYLDTQDALEAAQGDNLAFLNEYEQAPDYTLISEGERLLGVIMKLRTPQIVVAFVTYDGLDCSLEFDADDMSVFDEAEQYIREVVK